MFGKKESKTDADNVTNVTSGTEGTRYLRVKLPISIHKELKKRAVDADMSINNYVADILTKSIKLA